MFHLSTNILRLLRSEDALRRIEYNVTPMSTDQMNCHTDQPPKYAEPKHIQFLYATVHQIAIRNFPLEPTCSSAIFVDDNCYGSGTVLVCQKQSVVQLF